MNNQPGVTHCVMRRGASWFAFPAEKVREVLFRPPLLMVPHSEGVLAGLCHVRSEFFPVLRLDTLLVDDPTSLPAERQMLVLHGDEGPWGVLVDQVTALASLEASAAPEEDFHEDWSEVVSGWAAHETQVVRVLDPQRFYNLAEHLLCESWISGSALAGTAEHASASAAPPVPSPLANEGAAGNHQETKPKSGESHTDGAIQTTNEPAAANVGGPSPDSSPPDRTPSPPLAHEGATEGKTGASAKQSQPQS